jgi:hypothetical protein
MFGEAGFQGFTADDIRFTTKAGALYALLLDQPPGEVAIQALAAGQPGRVERVELLGAEGPLDFERGPQALKVRLPEAAKPVLRRCCASRERAWPALARPSPQSRSRRRNAWMAKNKM